MSLFEPFTLRGVTMRNRIVVSPMCQYSSTDGLADDWHLVHLGQFAVGGAAVVFTEATAVAADGRISPRDLGLWSDEHLPMLARIARFVREHGAVFGMQLSHAGRKASTARPWEGGGPVSADSGGWSPIHAPSAIPFTDGYQTPRALTPDGIAGVVRAFAEAARRAREAGVQFIELHAAHGYLLHEFLSPLANRRTDAYGGAFENRVRLLLEVVDAVRGVWPDELPLAVRISATDWREGGWTVEESIALAKLLGPRGVDLIDCSSGGVISGVRIPVGPGYQTPLAARVRAESGVATGTVGFITSPEQADTIIRTGQADVVIMARELLRDPHWPLRAARALKVDLAWPPQYERAKL